MGVLITLSDIIGLFVLVVAVLVLFVLWILRAIKQARCSHPCVHETQACDAICAECGKNLGFIGTWRKKHRGDQ